MSQSTQITEEDQIRIVEKVAYLQKEAEMLPRVIEVVPYNESPPDKPSILELLEQLKGLQSEYILPLLNDIPKKNYGSEDSKIEYPSLDTFEEQWNKGAESGKNKDVQKILQRIADQRAQIVEKVKEFSKSQFELSIDTGAQQLNLFELLEDIIEKETSILSEISDQVMVYSQQRSTQREIEERRNQQGGDSN